MRFSTIAVSAAAFGATAMALPGSVVYQTSVVTITSCAPEKTNCPGRSSSSALEAVNTYSPPPPPPVVTPTTGTPLPPVVTGPVVTPPAVTPGCPGGPHCPPPPVPSSGYSLPIPVHPNSTFVHPVPSVSKPVGTPVGPGSQGPYPTMTNKPVASVIPGTGLPYVPSGTGVPYPSKNTSVPVPTTPPTFTGSGSIQSFSILAVGAAVAAFFL